MKYCCRGRLKCHMRDTALVAILEEKLCQLVKEFG